LFRDIVLLDGLIMLDREYLLLILRLVEFALLRLPISYLYTILILGQGPKQFQGFDPQMEGTAEEFAAAASTVRVDESILEKSDVDFVWVLCGFLSHHFPNNHGWKGELDIQLAVNPMTIVFSNSCG
jgi:Argonaute siRNA chaperone (ARC) complex subunit Arb1